MPRNESPLSPLELGNVRELMIRVSSEIAEAERAAAAAAARAASLSAALAAVEARQLRLRAEAAAAGYGTPLYAEIVRIGDAEVAALIDAARRI